MTTAIALSSGRDGEVVSHTASVATLPALLMRASTALTNAVSAAEILEARDLAAFAYSTAKAGSRLARAKGAHDEIISTIYRCQADSLEIESKAKRRLADEYDAAQARGEVVGQAGGGSIRWEREGVRVLNENSKATQAEVGLTKAVVHSARQVRDAEETSPGIVRAALDDILDRGSEPTKAELSREINARLGSYSGDNEWYTPARYVEMAREVMGSIDIDPASNDVAQKTVKATRFYTEQDSGLVVGWSGTVWMNPPYSNPEVQQFTEMAVNEYESGRTTEAIILTNNSGDTAWHQSLAEASTAMCITRGRIRFESPTRSGNSPAMGQSFFYLGPNLSKFAAVFGEIGRITVNYREAQSCS